LHERFNVPVDSLGFNSESHTDTGRHYHYDLNAAQSRSQWRTDLPTYDVVILAEVLEHLYTSPTHVLSFLHTLVKPDGVLIIQTPNAVSLTKRIKLLIGMHPYERIREDNTNPGHFREYSGAELRAYATATGFDVVRFGYYNYFDIRQIDHSKSGRPRWLEAMKFHGLSLLPPALKPGITAILRARSVDAGGRSVTSRVERLPP
jgi:SAM-dependent methyltransferase